MTINNHNHELRNYFSFILASKHITFGKNRAFTRDTLIKMNEEIIKGRHGKFEFSDLQIKALKRAFVADNIGFNENTPKILTEDYKCIASAIEIDANSIDYVYWKDDREYPKTKVGKMRMQIMTHAKELALKNGYILKYGSPISFRADFDIALVSIKKDINSADYIFWPLSKKNTPEYKNLMQEIINNGYVLSRNSSFELKEDYDIALNSIKKNINTIQYTYVDVYKDPRIIKYLLTKPNTHFYNSAYNMSRIPLSTIISDKEIVELIIKKYTKDYQPYLELAKKEEYYQKYAELYYNALANPPKIKNFEAPLNYFAETFWESHYKDNLDDYNNIFSKICTELEDADAFKDKCTRLAFLVNMEKILGKEKYELLSIAMQSYYNRTHDIEDESLTLERSRDIIAKLSAKYVAMSKEFIKNQWLEHSYDRIKNFYVLNMNNPTIKKTIIEYQQRKKLAEIYDTDQEIEDCINTSIYNKYERVLDKDVIEKVITSFIVFGSSQSCDIIPTPEHFNEYKKYNEACKLITRLNKKYINYNDLEVANYKDVISYNEELKTYCYTGITFSSEEIAKFHKHERELYFVQKIKTDIMKIAKKINIDNKDIPKELYEKILQQFPFTDEYFEFNYNCLARGNYNGNYNANVFRDSCLPNGTIPPCALSMPDNNDNKYYQALSNYVINNNLLWLNLIENKEIYPQMEAAEKVHSFMMKDYILYAITNVDKIVDFVDTIGYDINDFNTIQKSSVLCTFADSKSIAIIGPNVVSKLCEAKAYTSRNSRKIIRIATELAAQMSKRSKSTVPYVSGTLGDYSYSIYDPHDTDILLAGIRTDACFKVDGNDNDFLHYCALDKNGFVLKIDDHDGNFIARGSGFRNGNYVYINQLRTIYDEGGDGYEGIYKSEKEEIINTFYVACKDIVNASQNNTKETDKIDYVFVNNAYALSNRPYNVSEEVKRVFGSFIMDNQSDDWREFVKNTKNLQECPDRGKFTTDFGGYELTCVARSKKSIIKPKDIIFKDVDALYERVRNEIIVTTKIDDSVLNKINKIEATYSYLYSTPYTGIPLCKDSMIFTGDNWYIVYNKSTKEITKWRLMCYDEEAKVEFGTALLTLEENNKLIKSKERNLIK